MVNDKNSNTGFAGIAQNDTAQNPGELMGRIANGRIGKLIIAHRMAVCASEFIQNRPPDRSLCQELLL